MGYAKKSTGTCEVCRESDKKVSMNHGLKACATCMAMQARINNSPEVVIAEMQRLHGSKYFPESVPESLDELSSLKAEFEEATGENDRLKELLLAVMAELDFPLEAAQEGLVDHIKGSNEHRKILVKQLEDLEERNEGLVEAKADLSAAYDDQQELLIKRLSENAELLARLEDQRECASSPAGKEILGAVFSITALLDDHDLLAALNVVASRLDGLASSPVVENAIKVDMEGELCA